MSLQLRPVSHTLLRRAHVVAPSCGSAVRRLHASKRVATARIPMDEQARTSPANEDEERPAGRTAPTTSSAAFIAAQAAEEEAAEVEAILTGDVKKPKVVPDPDAWDGEETRERVLKRILQDQYKPLRVKVCSPFLAPSKCHLYASVSTCLAVSSEVFELTGSTPTGLSEADSQAGPPACSGV